MMTNLHDVSSADRYMNVMMRIIYADGQVLQKDGNFEIEERFPSEFFFFLIEVFRNSHSTVSS